MDIHPIANILIILAIMGVPLVCVPITLVFNNTKIAIIVPE